MTLSDEQKAELGQRGIPVHGAIIRVNGTHIDVGSQYSLAHVQRMAEVAAVIGLSIPGYRLVTEEVAQSTEPFIRLWIDPATRSMGRPAPSVVTDLEALANALTGEEEN